MSELEEGVLAKLESLRPDIEKIGDVSAYFFNLLIDEISDSVKRRNKL